MKRLVVILMLLSACGAAQNSRYDNIAMGKLPGGNVLQALPNAIVTVMACSSMSTSCTTSASLCSSITDTNCNGSNTVVADSGGNFHFYAKPGRYSISIQAPSFAGFTIPDIILPVSASDGGGVGTSVTVNGTAAVPNSLNFNSNAPLPPSGSTIIQWGLNGNNVLGYFTGGGGGGGTPFTVNGVAPTGTVNFNASNPLPPPNGINVNWTLVGTGLTAAIVGDGNPNSCLIGTGIFAACPGGGGGGATLPTIPVWNLFASTGSGGAQDSGVAAEAGFVRAQVLEASGATGSAPSGFTPPNGSIEYFPTGATYGGVTVGTANGVAMHFSHSNVSGQAGNGGIALAGGNSSGVGTSYQIYLDCEQATGCDFKVPVSHNGTALGGGGGATLPSTTSVLAGDGSGGAVPTLLSDNGTTLNYTGTGGIAVSGVTGTGIAMTGAGGSLPTVAAGSGGIGIGPGGIPQYNANGAGWLNIGSGGTGGTVNWGSIGGTLSSQGDLNSALNAKIGLTSTLTPILCPGGQAAGGILSNGNATGCFTPAGGGGGGAGSPNQSVSFTSTTTASLTVTSATTALVWSCWDGPTFPANAIYPSNVSVSSAGLVTFTFAVVQSGYCVVNSTNGIGAAAPVSFTSATTATVTASGATPLWACWDTGSPANAIYPSNVSVNSSTYLVTFTFAVPQTGQCVVSGVTSGGATGGPTIYTCTISADTSFGTNICSQALGATARQWRVHCSLPWNFTGGSGTSNVVIGINLSATPSYQTYLTPVMWSGTGSSNMGAVAVSASGNTALVTANGLTAGTGGTIFTVNLDGTVAAAANTTIYIYGTATVGTAAFRPGVTCELI